MGHNISFDRMMRDNECYQDDPQRMTNSIRPDLLAGGTDRPFACRDFNDAPLSCGLPSQTDKNDNTDLRLIRERVDEI
jgi:hypothetical protein